MIYAEKCSLDLSRLFPSCLAPLFQNAYKNEFDLQENEPVGGTHFHMNGFAGNSKMTYIGRGAAHWEHRSSEVV